MEKNKNSIKKSKKNKNTKKTMEIMSPKNKKKTTTTTLSIPDDIILEILSWLTANSLLRLRWACKYLFHLIITRDTDDFVKLHLHRSTSTTTTIIHHPHNPTPYSLLLSKPFIDIDYDNTCENNNREDEEYFHPCKIFQCYIDYSITTGSFSYGPTNPILSGIFEKFAILGSCHGLILFSYEGTLCLWNPCTKEYKYLPDPNNFYGYEYFGCLVSFGLGYDHRIQDYKVIYNVNTLDASTNHVQVYTLGTNSWRDIGSFAINVRRRFDGHGVFVNGALYFIHGDQYFIGSGTIIFSLDFEKEVYEEISNQPDCLKEENGKTKILEGLAMFEGSLCLTIRTQKNPHKIDDDGFIHSTIETWVMKKDYNMNNNKEEYSWSKLYEIPHHVGLLRNFLQPLRFTKDGEILLLDRNDGLLSFDPKNNKVTINEDYKPHPIKQATAVDTHIIEAIYTESLVSLNSGTYIDEQGFIGRNNYDYDDVDEW